MPIAAPVGAPPVKRTPAVSGAKPTAAAVKKVEEEKQDRFKSRVDGLNSIASMFHLVFIGAKQHADAAAINRHAPNINNEVVKYAEGNEKFGESLDRLSDVSPIAGIATAVAPLLIQIAVNHGFRGMKAEQFAAAGVVTKTTLEAETATYLAQVELQALEKELQARLQADQARQQLISELED